VTGRTEAIKMAAPWPQLGRRAAVRVRRLIFGRYDRNTPTLYEFSHYAATVPGRDALRARR